MGPWVKCPLVPCGRPRSLLSGAVAAMPGLGESNHSFKCFFLWKAGLARDESLGAPPSAFPSAPLEKCARLTLAGGDRAGLCESAQSGGSPTPSLLPPPNRECQHTEAAEAGDRSPLGCSLNFP